MDEEKKCVICNREGLLALVGIGIGLLFVAISIDTLRRIRMVQASVEAEAPQWTEE